VTPGAKANKKLPVAHPKQVAEKVDLFAKDVEKGLAVGKTLARKKGEVNPTPCGDDADSRHVKGWDDPNGNPNHEYWYVGFSPFSIGVISHVDVKSNDEIPKAMTRLRDNLQKSGWKIDEFITGEWRKSPQKLTAEAPEKGYGVMVEGLAFDPPPRISVMLSSPCFRHPDELKS
jgi:hypothetical protein